MASAPDRDLVWARRRAEDIQIYRSTGPATPCRRSWPERINAVIESNPRFGPIAFDMAEQFLSGEPVHENVIIKDRAYDSSNAEEDVDSAY